MNKCPNCETGMFPSDASGIETYSCPNCNGIWISRGAISALLKQEKSPLDVPELIAESKEIKPATRFCASCSNQPLKPIIAGDVEVDACIKCGGLFLDEGEIQSLLPEKHKPLEDDVKSTIAGEGLYLTISAFFRKGC